MDYNEDVILELAEELGKVVVDNFDLETMDEIEKLLEENGFEVEFKQTDRDYFYCTKI